MSTVRLCFRPGCTAHIAARHPYPFCLQHLRKVPKWIRQELRVSSGAFVASDYLMALQNAMLAIGLAEISGALAVVEDLDEEERALCRLSCCNEGCECET